MKSKVCKVQVFSSTIPDDVYGECVEAETEAISGKRHLFANWEDDVIIKFHNAIPLRRLAEIMNKYNAKHNKIIRKKTRDIVARRRDQLKEMGRINEKS